MKSTGEKEMFREIWETREHVSEVSGKPLPPPQRANWHWCFAHILPKGLYPKARLSKENIVLLTPEEHTMFDGGSRTLNDPLWDELRKKKEELKRLYHQGYFDKP